MTRTSRVADGIAVGAVRVSVVIPARNAERFVCDAVASVLAQRGMPEGVTLEVIVVDNGSTDGTADVVRRSFEDDVRLVSEATQVGIGPARNAGIAVASGHLIALLDADDLWLPGKLAAQIEALRRAPDLSIVFCHGVEFADPPGSVPARDQPSPFVSGSALLARREAMTRAGPFPSFRSGEFVAWYGWTQALGLRAEVLPDVLLRRRVHATNSTRDRSTLTDYPLAMRWLLERRRALAEGRDVAHD